MRISGDGRLDVFRVFIICVQIQLVKDALKQSNNSSYKHSKTLRNQVMTQKKKPAQLKPKPSSLRQPSDNTESQLKAHFQKSGILFGISQDAIVKQLGRLLGRERFNEWEEVNFEKDNGKASLEDEYDLFQTPQEFATIFSLQANVSLAVAKWLDQAVASQYSTGQRILDLGCGSGILAAWFGSKYPDSAVVGCDAHPGMLKAALAAHNLSNLSFSQWNYRNSPSDSLKQFDILVSSLGIDFPTGRSYKDSLVIGKMKECTSYKKIKEFLLPCFANWRLAANDQALLYAVLRIPYESNFLAAVDAAQETGWKFDADAYKQIAVGDEHFPAMTFRVSDGKEKPIDESTIRASWLKRSLSEQCAIPLKDPVAMCLYESLGEKEILKEESKTYSDGHTMRGIVGKTPYFAFQFSHATTGFARLQMMPLSQVASLLPRFDWPD